MKALISKATCVLAALCLVALAGILLQGPAPLSRAIGLGPTPPAPSDLRSGTHTYRYVAEGGAKVILETGSGQVHLLTPGAAQARTYRYRPTPGLEKTWDALAPGSGHPAFGFKLLSGGQGLLVIWPDAYSDDFRLTRQ